MTDFELYCPYCEAKVKHWDFKAPTDHYRCYQCLEATLFYELPRRSILRTATGAFEKAPIRIRLRGSATNTATANQVTVPGVSADAGDVLVVIILNDGFTEQGAEYLRFNLAWGSITGVGGGAGEWSLIELHTTNVTNTTMTKDATAQIIQTAQTNDLVVDWSPLFPSEKKIVTVMTVSGLASPNNNITDFWYFFNQVNTQGTSTTPTAADAIPRRAETIVISGIGTNGPESDDAGTWTGGFTSLIREGSETGTNDRTLDVAYRIVSSLGTYPSGKTGITSRPWLTDIIMLDRL